MTFKPRKLLEIRKLTCVRCAADFFAKMDHGKWPRYCSRACFDNRRLIRTQDRHKKCANCDGVFKAATSRENSDGLKKFCSVKCSNEGRRHNRIRICESCGIEIVTTDSRLRDYNVRFCSTKCSGDFMQGARGTNWKGGAYIDATADQVRVLLRRPGFVSPYIAEHRVIASKAIGRMLAPHEPIIHINGINQDNRPDNLFICGSKSELTRRFNGSLPFPTQSNLGAYR